MALLLCVVALAVAGLVCSPRAMPTGVPEHGALDAGSRIDAAPDAIELDALPGSEEPDAPPPAIETKTPPVIPARQCPPDMALVRGAYCPVVQQRCLGYLDPPGRYHEYRCREYAAPATCLSERIAMEFCIDLREYTPPGQALPADLVSFRDAMRICRDAGKRLCRESEWNFACEGEAMLPYPYGFQRDSAICHADRTDILEDEPRRVKDLRKPSGQMAGCKSPFGVFDMAGNMEELAALDGPGPLRPVMKGDWWHPGRNHCRARQTFHNDVYKGVETGFRCCADAAPADSVPDGGAHSQ